MEDHLGEDVVLEHELEAVTQPDGRSGRVDILMFRSRRDDNSTERLVVELKRPTVKVGPKELNQIKNYSRAIIDDPQYSGVRCKWRSGDRLPQQQLRGGRGPVPDHVHRQPG
jgi:hypothetical protein